MALRWRPNRAALRQLLDDPAVVADTQRRAEAIAQACNSQSTWGGYVARPDDDADRARSVVLNVDPDASPDEARNLRMLSNMDAGQ